MLLKIEFIYIDIFILSLTKMSGKDKSKYSKQGREAKKHTLNSDTRPKFTYLQSDDDVSVNVGGQSFKVKFGSIDLRYYGLKLDLSARITQEQQVELMKAKLVETEANARRDREELVKLRAMVSANSKKVSENADLSTITSKPASWADEPVVPVESVDQLASDDFEE